MPNFILEEVREDHAKALIEFVTTFEASTDPSFWTKLIHEETLEVVEAFEKEGLAEQLKELADLRYVMVGFTITRSSLYALMAPQEVQDRMEVVDGLLNEIYDKMEEEPRITDDLLEKAFKLVHKSNMSKLDEEGKPIRREDGKVLKGPNYVEPDMAGLVKEAA